MEKSITPIGTPGGIDVHKRRCEVVELHQGRIKVRKPMANTREEWLEMLAELPPDAEIGLEVSTAGIDSNRRQKNDRLDAERLARKLAAHHVDPLPEAWFPPPEIRALRLRARARCWLALLRTQCKNHLQSPLQMQGLLPPGSDPFGGAGQKWLAEQKLPLPLTESIPQIQRLLKVLEEEIEISEKYLAAVEQQFPEIVRLRTIPGIGPILAPVIWSELGTIERFRSAKALANDTGLVASFYDSGDVQVSGPITRHGSRWLRWALVTAANVVIQYPNPFSRRYHRLRRGKKPSLAKAAIAHSLARCVYGVLKHGCPYREDRWGRKIGALEQEARGSHRSTKTVL